MTDRIELKWRTHFELLLERFALRPDCSPRVPPRVVRFHLPQIPLDITQLLLQVTPRPDRLTQANVVKRTRKPNDLRYEIDARSGRARLVQLGLAREVVLVRLRLSRPETRDVRHRDPVRLDKEVGVNLGQLGELDVHDGRGEPEQERLEVDHERVRRHRLARNLTDVGSRS